MRKDAREAVFKIVFANLFHDECEEKFRKDVYRKDKLSEDDCEYAERLYSTVTEHKGELLSEITDRVKNFLEYRIFPADKAIMLIALAEIKYFDDIPAVVSVSEAAGLARKYSAESSADFVNGVLGGVINE